MPHSETPGSPDACSSPGRFAACRVLPRLSVPRHPPCALPSFAPLPPPQHPNPNHSPTTGIVNVRSARMGRALESTRTPGSVKRPWLGVRVLANGVPTARSWTNRCHLGARRAVAAGRRRSARLRAEGPRGRGARPVRRSEKENQRDGQRRRGRAPRPLSWRQRSRSSRVRGRRAAQELRRARSLARRRSAAFSFAFRTSLGFS